ncbi:uncharacterized protein LOC123418618, partial [Hordeum vulgare subsp. vulgare]|uniref:uncharacterized protein LOC123418618 n=1 Tax=Hordeum vulgare subsp. vulgare TaxID=112509 RepID=UPI001D1A5137
DSGKRTALRYATKPRRPRCSAAATARSAPIRRGPSPSSGHRLFNHTDLLPWASPAPAGPASSAAFLQRRCVSPRRARMVGPEYVDAFRSVPACLPFNRRSPHSGPTGSATSLPSLLLGSFTDEN